MGNQKAVRVFHKRDSSGRQRNSRWPSEIENYCRFVLYKENKDTMDAINLLSKLLRIKAGIFGYAGTKDRRAVTTQQVSVYRVRAEQLQELNSSLRNLCLGNFQYCKEPLKLGSLSGNHFIITLRNVVGDHREIEESLKSLKINGFINYFGLQRFGTTSVPTHRIGMYTICHLFKVLFCFPRWLNAYMTWENLFFVVVQLATLPHSTRMEQFLN